MTLTEAEYATAGGHTPSLTKRWRIAYRSDGSVSRVPHEPGSYDMRTVLLTSEMSEIRAVDPLKLKTTIPLTPNRVASMRHVQTTSDCQDPGVVKRQFIGEDAPVLGHRTLKYSSAESTPDGDKFIFSYWYAPNLDCRPLRQRMELLRADGTRAVMEKLVESVTIGEPDPSLFIVPAEYVESLPSAIAAETQKRLGGKAVSEHQAAREYYNWSDARYLERGNASHAESPRR